MDYFMFTKRPTSSPTLVTSTIPTATDALPTTSVATPENTSHAFATPATGFSQDTDLPFQKIRATNLGALQLLAANHHEVTNVVTNGKMNAIGEDICSNWDTGMMLITELTMRTFHPAIPEMVRYICSQQNPDGGWSDGIGDTESGPSASLINHAALVAYYKRGLESGEITHLDQTEAALKKSWSHWTGKVPPAEKLLNPLPWLKVVKTPPFGLMFYFNVFPPVTTKLPFGKLLAALFPSPKFISKIVKKHGIMPQLKDFVFGAVLYLLPPSSLDTKKLQNYETYLLKTRSEGGLFCYVPMLTGLAVMGLDRASGDDPHIRALNQESLNAARQLYTSGSEGVRVSTYAPNTFYSVEYLLARLTENPLCLEQDQSIRKTLEYVLACRSEDDMFHQMYRGDEAEDGLILMTAKVLQLAGLLSTLSVNDPTLAQSEHYAQYLTRFNELVPELAALLAQKQNVDGGFSTFTKTDIGKKPGAMKNANFDASTASITATVLSGLAAVGLTPENSDAAKKALDWLRSDFKAGAGWWNRFGGGYMSGNAAVIPALKAAGIDTDNDAQVQEVISVLRSRQDITGAWGETTGLLDDPKIDAAKFAMTGDNHPIHTAYGIMMMVDAGVATDDPALVAAVNSLLHEFKDPSGVIAKLNSGEMTSFTERDGAAWSMPYGTTTFSPPKWRFFVSDQTLADLYPVMALQKYLAALMAQQQM